MSLVPTLKLSLEMTNALTQIERNGLRINLDTLADIRKEYEQEMMELEVRLMQLAREAVGDTPINLSSPDDRSVLLYSRRVRDKKEWARYVQSRSRDAWVNHETQATCPHVTQRSSMAQCAGRLRLYTRPEGDNALTAPEKAVHGLYAKMAPPVRQYAYVSPAVALASFTSLRGK